ncbi:MAG: DNA alkylation repair protein [Ruminococcaceae bacterium]|nr:DNA alkylation repair protein [Oscillospiraceae bacterium]
MDNQKLLLAAEIRGELFKMADSSYKDFHSKLIPTVNKDMIIGVRTPDLRKFAKTLKKTKKRILFLDCLPHKYYDENNLHAFLIEQEKDFTICLSELNRFLPYVDNWATCDMMNPKALKKDKEALLFQIRNWIYSENLYTVRFGLKMLMDHFLDEDFSESYLELAASVKSEEYYINMMISWFFATALAKRYEQTLPFIKEKRLSKFCNNKTISKACDSLRISKERKVHLKTLIIN